MKVVLRRAVLGCVLAGLWVTPYLLPFREGPDPAGFTTGWYVAFILGAVWPFVVAWSFLAEQSMFEERSPAAATASALVAVVGGAVALVVDRVIWPSMCLTCELPGPPPSDVLVHHVVLIQGGAALGLPALFLLLSRAAGHPIRAARVPLRGLALGIALALFLTPPYLLYSKVGQLMAFVVACGLTLVRGLPALEERFARRRLLLRATIIALGVCAWVAPLDDTPIGNWRIFLLHTTASLKLTGIGAAFLVLCMTAADLLARVMRHAKSVRERMLILGLCCGIFGVAIAGARITLETPNEPTATVFNALLKLLILGMATYTFASSLARGLSRSLEQSARAISEIRRGNLDVSLDDSGRDEVAAVARTFNQMVGMLREAEFLEKINSDLQSRSKQLAATLEALRAAQTDLVRAERMASVATLVKGIAHELNNPITYIGANIAPLTRYCSFLTGVANRLSDGRARDREELAAITRLSAGKDLAFVTDDLARLTADIGEGARRAELIIRDLQSLTSASQRGIERVDLHRVVRQTVSLMGPRLLSGVHIETDLSPTPSIPARAGQLEQVLVNLTDNAVRAVGERGLIRICVGREAEQAVIKVIDDGAGMSADVARQAFEPFFTTRAAGEGSGLGLAIVASIVRAHNGAVTLTSEVGKGTQVDLRLPIKPDLFVETELPPISAGG